MNVRPDDPLSIVKNSVHPQVGLNDAGGHCQHETEQSAQEKLQLIRHFQRTGPGQSDQDDVNSETLRYKLQGCDHLSGKDF